MTRARTIGVYALLFVGLLQSIGYALGISAIRGLGTAFVASPLPLVFSHFRGLETFSSDFNVSVTSQSGNVIQSPLTPQNYGLLDGPYNRRNVYGAVAAYGPKLTEGNEPKLVQTVLHYGFCKGALTSALKITEPIRKAQIRVTNPWSKLPLDQTMEVTCE